MMLGTGLGNHFRCAPPGRPHVLRRTVTDTHYEIAVSRSYGA